MNTLGKHAVTAAYFAALALFSFNRGIAAEKPDDYASLVKQLVVMEGSCNVGNRIDYLDTRDNPLPVAPLLPLLQHESPKVRQGAAYTLRLMQNRKECSTALLAAARCEQDVFALTEIVRGLGAVRNTAATPLLSKLMVKHRSPEVRYAAVEAEYWIRDTKAVPALIQATRDPTDKVATRGLYVLGHIGDNRAVARIVQVAQMGNLDKRASAVQALGMIGAPETAPLLCSYLKAQDTALLRQVVWALGRAHNGKTVASLLPFLEHEDKTISEETRLSLIQIGSDEVLMHFIGRYRKNPDTPLALGVIRSLYLQRGQVIGEPVKKLPEVQMVALAQHFSAALKKKVQATDIKSIRHADGTLFVQVVFGDSGSDFIVIQDADGTFRGVKVILSWIT